MKDVMFISAYTTSYLRTRDSIQSAYRFVGIYDLSKKTMIIPVRCSKCGKTSVMVLWDNGLPVYGECLDCHSYQKLYYSYTSGLNKPWLEALGNNNYILN